MFSNASTLVDDDKEALTLWDDSPEPPSAVAEGAAAGASSEDVLKLTLVDGLPLGMTEQCRKVFVFKIVSQSFARAKPGGVDSSTSIQDTTTAIIDFR